MICCTSCWSLRVPLYLDSSEPPPIDINTFLLWDWFRGFVYLGPISIIGWSPRTRQRESSLLFDMVVSHVLDSSSLEHR
uniref:Uncharacterized protein n=1 Tax=Picea glauca TaxID=3330 RepID=A0A101M2L2_PICGL|nr:hypothetical protein ABT39_MTgene3029 [Picea glauca]